jgi:hypothetical protein
MRTSNRWLLLFPPNYACKRNIQMFRLCVQLIRKIVVGFQTLSLDCLLRKSICTSRWPRDHQRTRSSRRNLTSVAFPTVSTVLFKIQRKGRNTHLRSVNNLTKIILSKRSTIKESDKFWNRSDKKFRLKARQARFWDFRRLNCSSWPKPFRMLSERRYSLTC